MMLLSFLGWLVFVPDWYRIRDYGEILFGEREGGGRILVQETEPGFGQWGVLG